MKKILFIIGLNLMFGIYNRICSQEFRFDLFFEDSAGHRDTIILGYDIQATKGIDTLFGEINIIDQPRNNEFDVRISDEWENRLYDTIPGTFHTKNQIVKKMDCDHKFTITSIDILTKEWPVTMRWDSTLFSNFCYDGSLFTSFYPGGWWDTGGDLVLFKEKSILVFTPWEYPSFRNKYGYINTEGDTIRVFWQTFGAKDLLFNNVNDVISDRILKIFPNPATDNLYLEFPNNFNPQSTYILNCIGKTCKIIPDNTRLINTSNLEIGIYFIVAKNKDGTILTGKFLK
ncbi:MAG: T9SS type A sorting domain-containing protein [Saprospiraceae bacterium]|nr:T9SS type A sorting domain-containing protein [Saprospiraceae bacterium]